METFQRLASSLLKSLCLYDFMHLGTHISTFALKEAYGGSGDTDLNFLETNAAN